MRPIAFAVLLISVAAPWASVARAQHLSRAADDSASTVSGRPDPVGLADGAITSRKLQAFPLRSSCRVVDRSFLSSPHRNNHFSPDVADVPSLIGDCISYYAGRYAAVAVLKGADPAGFRRRWGMRYDKQPSPTTLSRRHADVTPRNVYRLWRDVQTATLIVDEILQHEGHQP